MFKIGIGGGRNTEPHDQDYWVSIDKTLTFLRYSSSRKELSLVTTKAVAACLILICWSVEISELICQSLCCGRAIVTTNFTNVELILDHFKRHRLDDEKQHISGFLFQLFGRGGMIPPPSIPC